MIEAYENSIINVRPHGYGKVRNIEPFELVKDWTKKTAPE